MSPRLKLRIVDLIGLLLLLVFAAAATTCARASVPSKPYTFTPNTTAQSAQVNADFDTLYSTLNAQLDSTNFSLARGLGANYVQSGCVGCTGTFAPGAYAFAPAAVNNVPLSVYGVASQTSDLFDVLLTNGGTKVAWVNAAGQTNLASALIGPSATNAVPSIVNAAAGQTADIQEWQLNGVTKSGVNAAGSIYSNALIDTALLNAACLKTDGSGTLQALACATSATAPITLGSGAIGCATCVTGVSATAPIASSGGTTPQISCATCVTSVTANAPITSSGGVAPAISCSGCVTTSSNGYAPCFTSSGSACGGTFHIVRVAVQMTAGPGTCNSGLGFGGMDCAAVTFSGNAAFSSGGTFSGVTPALSTSAPSYMCASGWHDSGYSGWWKSRIGGSNIADAGTGAAFADVYMKATAPNTIYIFTQDNSSIAQLSYMAFDCEGT